MLAGYYSDTNFIQSPARAPRRKPHYFLAFLIFLGAYFISVSVHAQQDAIRLNSNKVATIVGTVKEADDNFVIVTSAGKDIKVVLDDVHLRGEADTVFTRGMTVTVDGTMEGDDFGLPLMDAKSITATAPSAPVQK